MQNCTLIGATVAEISLTGQINCPKNILTAYLETLKDICIKSGENMYGLKLYHHAVVQIFTLIGTRCKCKCQFI